MDTAWPPSAVSGKIVVVFLSNLIDETATQKSSVAIEGLCALFGWLLLYAAQI